MTNIREDLRSGLRLARLFEVLTGGGDARPEGVVEGGGGARIWEAGVSIVCYLLILQLAALATDDSTGLPPCPPLLNESTALVLLG